MAVLLAGLLTILVIIGCRIAYLLWSGPPRPKSIYDASEDEWNKYIQTKYHELENMMIVMNTTDPEFEIDKEFLCPCPEHRNSIKGKNCINCGGATNKTISVGNVWHPCCAECQQKIADDAISGVKYDEVSVSEEIRDGSGNVIRVINDDPIPAYTLDDTSIMNTDRRIDSRIPI